MSSLHKIVSSVYGNYDPNFTPKPSDYIYIDLNASVSGDGLSSSSPTKVLPTNLANGAQLLFNSDNGIQALPTRYDCLLVDGSNVQISSYGSTEAVVSGFTFPPGNWTQQGASGVWSLSFPGLTTNAGPLVGCAITTLATSESPQGNVLKWKNLDANDGATGTNAGTDLRAAFVSDPTVLGLGFYAYDYVNGVMYVNVGGDPTSHIGISACGRFVNVQGGQSPSKVTVHNLRLIGFAHESINIVHGSNAWRVYGNEFYGTGGFYSTTAKYYLGSGVQMSHQAANIEIDHNRIDQTFDSPVTPQHFGGSNGELINNVHIHHNTVSRWALAAVEISDFGTNNQTSNVLIEWNRITGGGTGYSATGDTPQGYTDAVHIRGGNASGLVSAITVQNNTLQSHNAAFGIHGNNGSQAVVVDSNRLSSSNYGIINERPLNMTVQGTNNQLCANLIKDISDTASGSTYSGNSTQAAECYVTPRVGEGI